MTSEQNTLILDRSTAVADGVVLEGQTHTYHAKHMAQHARMEAIDLPIHANDILVF
jgi:hypothetical protein